MNGVRRLLLLAMNDLRLATKDRMSFFWMLILPIAMMWFFGQTSSGGGGAPQISLTVDDRDGGWLARAFVAELEDDQVNLQEVGQPLPDGDEVSRLRTLVVPEGMTESVLTGGQETLRLELDPDADQTFGMGAQIHIWRGILRLLARFVEMELSVEGVPEDPDAAAVRFAAIAAAPPLVRVAVETAGTGDPVPSGYGQSVPGILTMVVLMMTLIYGGVFLVTEKNQGMLKRQLALPLGRRQILAAKLVGRLLIAAIQLILLLAIGRFVFGLGLGSSPLGLLALSASFAVAVAGLSVFLGAILKTVEQASTLGWILSMVLAGLGGCWWPREVMPDWLQQVSYIFPTSWAMDGFHALISFGRGLEAVIVPSLVLLAFGTVFTGLGARFLRAD